MKNAPFTVLSNSIYSTLNPVHKQHEIFSQQVVSSAFIDNPSIFTQVTVMIMIWL